MKLVNILEALDPVEQAKRDRRNARRRELRAAKKAAARAPKKLDPAAAQAARDEYARKITGTRVPTERIKSFIEKVKASGNRDTIEKVTRLLNKEATRRGLEVTRPTR